jgi:hypothetical protein
MRRSCSRLLDIAARVSAPAVRRHGGPIRKRSLAPMGLVAGVACGLLWVPAASAASSSPPPPKSTTGKTVTQVAAGGGLATPTSFAFGDGQVFEGDAGKETSKIPNGGVFVLSNGTATKLAGPLVYVSGLAWHDGSLYVAGGSLTGRRIPPRTCTAS